eukprot:4689466-Pyramimonas_sp.AAC.1
MSESLSIHAARWRRAVGVGLLPADGTPSCASLWAMLRSSLCCWAPSFWPRGCSAVQECWKP